MCDGMHISQNLVFRSSDGSLVGFAKLDEVDRELERLEVLAYLVKGMASDVKCVIASFPFKIFTKEMMYKRTWDVIRHLETAGIKILALICDGHPINRAFMMMHTPFTTGTTFSCIFDTINFCAPEKRLLFFISDVCHLLKTIRNAFFNSGEGPKKPRLLTINGEIITWKTIVRLYFQYKNNNFRKSYKLNAQNVFPDSYSRMKVRYAAQPMSNTVAQDIEDQKWPGTEETVRFIRLIDRFFDCLNGAHTSMANRKNKPDLAPYTVDNIDYEVKEGRFKFLRDFIAYLADWKKQVYRLPLSAEEKEKRILPIQTLIGIETSIRAIEAATVYFLDPQKGGGKFVNARIFSQDPLEQHFSKQRGRGGGSRNPNVAQFQQGQVVTALQRGLGVRKRKGNSTEEDVSVEVVSEPLPKKARYSKK
ncbi:hypothetical protein ONE63_011276 [Megalurothrips usitatus]|uniref:Transposable element P transposase n=1 Tax=Megalurothrips usitatus TaxID=439358 RepID=A0AAV7X2X4_9NEOP|nr:hypothetical protein ONE63_011276 [Megalurothrips usitatus]